MTQEEKEVLENLKQGDVFYNATFNGIDKYEYLMLYPFHNPANVKIDGYHIVLAKNLDIPERLYYKQLASILLKGLKTYEEAKAMKIKFVEEHLELLKSR